MRRIGRQTNLSDSLGRLVSRLDKKSGGSYKQLEVSRAWVQVAGESVLAHTHGEFLREGELVIKVDSPLWAGELSALSEQYKNSINDVLGKNLVTKVRFTVSRSVSRERARGALAEKDEEFYKPAQVPLVKLSEAEKEAIEAAAEAIEDADLRDAVIRAHMADVQRKRGIEAAEKREKASGGL